VDVSTYRRSLDNAMRSLAGLVRLVLGAVVPRTRDQKIEAAYLLTGGVRAARLDTHRIAANYLQHRGVDVSGFPARPQEYRFKSVIDTLDRVIDPVAEASSPQVAAKVAEDLTRALRRHAEEPARALVRQAAAVTGGSWARVLTGPTSCSFCVMMASRGPVYESSENAVRSGPGKTMFEGTEVAAVHDGCDCVTAFVPKGSKAWEGRAQWLALQKAWDECGPDGDHRADDDARPDRLVFRSWWEQTVRDGKGPHYIAPSMPDAAPLPAASKPSMSKQAVKKPSVKAESKAEVARRLLPGMEKILADLRSQGLPEDDPRIVWHKRRIDELRADLEHEPAVPLLKTEKILVAANSGGGGGSLEDNGPTRIARSEGVPPITASGTGGPPKPPDRTRGMLGPGMPDEFGRFGDFEPPTTRSDIEGFSIEDAVITLDGDGSYEAALLRHNGDISKARMDAGHGYHGYGLGIKISEFPEGWSPADVVDFANAIVDSPSWAEDDTTADGFYLYGVYRGQVGTLAIRPYGRWMIASVIPDDLRYNRLRD